MGGDGLSSRRLLSFAAARSHIGRTRRLPAPRRCRGGAWPGPPAPHLPPPAAKHDGLCPGCAPPVAQWLPPAAGGAARRRGAGGAAPRRTRASAPGGLRWGRSVDRPWTAFKARGRSHHLRGRHPASSACLAPSPGP